MAKKTKRVEPEVSENGEHGSRQVLIAFEEPLILATIGLALRREGYFVHEAGCLQDAARLWYEHAGTIGVAVIDDDLDEGETGIDLVARVRRADPSLGVLFAARGDAAARAAAESALSPEEVLLKPFGLGQLSDALAQKFARAASALPPGRIEPRDYPSSPHLGIG